MNPALPDLCREHRTKPIPPIPNRLVTNIDSALKEHILDLAERQRIPNVHHHGETDDFGRTVEIAEGIFHPETLSEGMRQRQAILL